MGQIAFRLPELFYKRDPQTTPLGQRILRQGVELMDVLGFEQFTFKKLATEVQSTEPSMYRYFDNKHKFLHYLTAWYWSWLEYRMDLATRNLGSSAEKLHASIRVLVEEKKDDPVFHPVNGEALYRIITSEWEKTFFTKWVDGDYSAGYFDSISAISNRLATLIHDVHPAYEYSGSLASVILLQASKQPYLRKHVPSMVAGQGAGGGDRLRSFLESLAFGAPAKKA